MKINDIIFPQDINKLPNAILKEICTDINLETSGTSHDLSQRIWGSIDCINDETSKKIKEKVLAGRTAITWYDLSTGGNLKGAKDEIIKKSDFNPFEKLLIPEKHRLTSDPVLIGAAEGDSDDEYYLRFMYKSGVLTDYYVGESTTRIKQETVTVYVNEQLGIIEVRTDPKRGNKVASKIAMLMGQQVTLEQTNILAPFGSKVEGIADVLDGELIDTVGKPELTPENFKEEQAKAIVNVLAALDEYFKEPDIDVLENRLKNGDLSEEILSMPFTSLLLSGLETVGLGSVRELRGLPLYDYLTPYLQKQNGSIIFNVNHEGFKQEFSIKVGINTKNIFFNTPASEAAIKYVRDRLILVQPATV